MKTARYNFTEYLVFKFESSIFGVHTFQEIFKGDKVLMTSH